MIHECTYRDSSTSKTMVVKSIDEKTQVKLSAIEACITSSIDHPHIVQSAYPPLVHHIKRKVPIERLPQPEPSKQRFQILKSAQQFIPRINTRNTQPRIIRTQQSEYAPPEYDIDYRRILIFQEKALGDLLHCPWIGNESSILIIAWQLLNALYALHKERIIHADVKPDNVLYYDMNRIQVKLADFTVASIISSNGNTGAPGSPSYMAPEILAGERWNEKIDIWALGCTLYYLYYGVQLIPIQSDKNELDGTSSRSIRMKRELKVISTILDSSRYHSRTQNVTGHVMPRNNPLSEESTINDLLILMLQVDYMKRPSAKKLLESVIFNNQPIIIQPYNTYVLDSSPLPDKYTECIQSMCNSNSELFYSSIRLASQVWELREIIPPLNLIRSCVSIAYRILYNGVIRSDYRSLPSDEDIIFNFTGFKILSIINK
jgi:serine/threonine protein kinase